MDPQQWQRVKATFAQVVEQPAERRAALLAELCAGDDALQREVASLLAAHEDTRAPLGPATLSDGDAAAPSSCLRRSTLRGVPHPEGDWPRRDGRRVPGRACRRRVPAAGRAEDRRAHVRRRGGAAALPARAPDPRHAEPSAHRPPARWRCQRRRRAVLRDGVRRRAVASTSTARSTISRWRSGWRCSSTSVAPWRTRTSSWSSTATSSRPTSS